MGYREQDNNSPVNAYQDIFSISKRRQISTSKGHTLNGGLYVIGQHIETTNDYIIFKDLEYWFGGVLPDLRTSSSLELIGDKEKSQHIKGCILHSSFSWHPDKMEFDNWIRIDDKALIENLLSKYRIKFGNSELLESFILIDERMIGNWDDNRRKKYFFEKFKYKTTNTGKNENREKETLAVIYLPHRGMTKHQLAFRILPEIIRNLSKTTTIIVADIPDEERIVYYEALNTKCDVEVAKSLWKVKQIILLSNSLSICAFEID